MRYLIFMKWVMVLVMSLYSKYIHHVFNNNIHWNLFLHMRTNNSKKIIVPIQPEISLIIANTTQTPIYSIYRNRIYNGVCLFVSIQIKNENQTAPHCNLT